jgi:hypothetical protein
VHPTRSVSIHAGPRSVPLTKARKGRQSVYDTDRVWRRMWGTPRATRRAPHAMNDTQTESHTHRPCHTHTDRVMHTQREIVSYPERERERERERDSVIHRERGRER